MISSRRAATDCREKRIQSVAGIGAVFAKLANTPFRGVG